MSTTMLNILKTVAKTCEKVLRLTKEVKSRQFSFTVEKPYNKTTIDFNFRRHYTVISCLFIVFRPGAIVHQVVHGTSG